MLVLLAITICIVLSNKSMELDPIVNKILDLEKVSNCKITSLADYSNISIYLENPEITKEDIDTYIKARLEGYGNIELTDEFVQINLGYETVLEYKHVMTERLKEQNKIALIMESREEVLEQLLENSKFIMDEEQVAEYALCIVRGYETEAYISNMSLEEYAESVLEVTYDEFFEMCYEEGEQLIETYLIIGAIANAEKINTIMERRISITNINSWKTKYIRYLLRQRKVFNTRRKANVLL